MTSSQEKERALELQPAAYTGLKNVKNVNDTLNIIQWFPA